MSILALLIGLGLPTVSGWLLLGLIENPSPVLDRMERWVVGSVLGMTLMMALVFVSHILLAVPLSRTGYLGIEVVAVALLGGMSWWKRPSLPAVSGPPSPRPRWEMLLWVLVGLAVVKIMIAATTFLLLTPTFLDDALDNWNLRGKVFFVDQSLTLVMPGEDPATSPLGVSSYPPTVPLLKASLAAIAGEWTDPLVNIIHVVWFFLAAALLYAAVRRMAQRHWALLAVYAYLSLPLATMHGTNPYADIFVSLHVFLAAFWLLQALSETDPRRRSTWMLLLGVAFAALSFTKNEGIVLYLPPMILILVVGIGLRLRRNEISVRGAIGLLLRAAIPLVVVALPWLVFKWSQGLTFGNAKSFTDFSIHWRENVLLSVIINTFFEANWLFLFPLFFTLVFWRWRCAWRTLLPLTAFVAIVYVGQLLIFLFTDLAAEALMQTGYARGLIQLSLCFVFLTALLLRDALTPPQPRVTPAFAE